jgi:hypothetical protein
MNKLYIPDSYTPTISIEQYRTLTGDQYTSDELVTQRIFYIERLCRGVIQQELRNTYADKR